MKCDLVALALRDDPRDAQRDGRIKGEKWQRWRVSCLDLILLWDVFAYCSFWF
jgi:hypothetical protein